MSATNYFTTAAKVYEYWLLTLLSANDNYFAIGGGNGWKYFILFTNLTNILKNLCVNFGYFLAVLWRFIFRLRQCLP